MTKLKPKSRPNLTKRQRHKGGKLKAARLALGLTQQEVADQAGCGVMTVIRAERSDLLPRNEATQRACKLVLKMNDKNAVKSH